MNKFRLTTNLKSNSCDIDTNNIVSINSKVLFLFSLARPYVIKGVNRYLRETNKLVSER
jgi:hypothetical protein